MNIKIRSSSCLLDKNRIICVLYNCSSVFEIDMSTFNTRYVCGLRNSFESQSVIGIEAGSDIFLVNLWNGAIAKFSILQQKEIYVKEPETAYRFANAFYVNHYIYLVPKVIKDTFLLFDIKKEIFVRDEKWNSICRKEKITGFIRNAEMDNAGRIVCTIGKSNILFRYDTRKKESDILKIGNNEINLKCILVAMDKYYILPDNANYLYTYDLRKEDYAEMRIGERKSENYIREILIKDKLFLQTENKVDIYDINTGHFYVHLKLPEDFHNDLESTSLFLDGFYLEEKYYLFPYGANMMLEIGQDYKCIGRKLIIRPEDIALIYYQSSHIISEATIPIEIFLDSEFLYNCNKIRRIENKKLYGEAIYKKIKDEY